MSGLAGCWCSWRSDEWSTKVDALVAGMSHRGSVFHSSAPAPGLTLSALGRRMPNGTVGTFDESPDLVVTFDGYLTDRQDLARDLGLPRETASATIVAALIRDHGVAGLRRLVGHFAFAAWWRAGQRVLLARDAIGIRPLFIGHRDGSWAWSSTLKPLARILGRGGDIDDEFIADYFTRSRATIRTPFKSVESVPAGSVLQIGPEGSRVSRIWEPVDTSAGAPAADASEYRDRFFAAVRAAVDDAPGVLFTELSGGWDSTSIVCVADHLHATGRLARRIETISHRYDRSPSSDELLWIAAVEQHRQRAGHHLLESNGWLFEGLDRAIDDDLPSPMLCFGGLARQRRALARRDEGAIVLSGVGGDQVTSGTRSEAVDVADLLWNGEVSAVLKALPAWSKVLRRPLVSILTEAAALAVNPRATRRMSGWAKRYLPPWLHPRFVREHALIERVAERSWPGDSHMSPGVRYRLGLVQDAAARAWWSESRGGRNYVETRFPFLEPRLVDWALRLRFGCITRPDELRAMVRRNLGDLLPDAISQRKGKRGPDEAILRAVWSQWAVIGELMHEPLVVERGYVDATALARSVEKAYHGAETEMSWFVKTLGLEIWLRHLGAAPPTAVASEPRRVVGIP